MRIGTMRTPRLSSRSRCAETRHATTTSCPAAIHARASARQCVQKNQSSGITYRILAIYRANARARTQDTLDWEIRLRRVACGVSQEKLATRTDIGVAR